MDNKKSIREFAQGLLDKTLPIEEQSVICSSDVNLIGGDNGGCTNDGKGCVGTNNKCLNTGSICSVATNWGCTNKDLNDLTTCLPVGPTPDPG